MGDFQPWVAFKLLGAVVLAVVSVYLIVRSVR